MFARRLPAVVLVVTLLAIGGFGLRIAGSRTPQPNSSADPNQLFQITPKRIVMAPRLQTLCYRPRMFGPHEEPAEILIYANKIAIDYRRNHPNEFDYPIGSKFVKEKFPHAGDKHPDGATIMEKTSTKQTASDWKFSLVSLPDNAPVKSADLKSCVACHRDYGDTGYISSESEQAIRTFLRLQ